MMLSPILYKDRTPDNNLRPESKERILGEIENYVGSLGVINISEIARQLKLSWPATKELIQIIQRRWIEENETDLLVQIKWLQRMLGEAETCPESFTAERAQFIKFKLEIFDKVNRLLVLLDVIKLPKPLMGRNQRN